MLDFERFTQEIIEFTTKETLKAIDWGVLDLGHIENLELKKVLIVIERQLTLELEENYRYNTTGIFRVFRACGLWCYAEYDYVIRAESLCDLKRIVECQNRIWYVFDEVLLKEIWR